MKNILSVSLKKVVLTILFASVCLTSHAQLQDVDDSNSQLYYSGSLGETEPIELNMQISGYAVSGSYMFISSGDIFVFKGRLSADKTGMGVLVYNAEDNYIASIEAKVISEDVNFAHEIKGTWKPVDCGLNKRLFLTKVAEFASLNDKSRYSYSD